MYKSTCSRGGGVGKVSGFLAAALPPPAVVGTGGCRVQAMEL